ncbi:MAG: 3-hydroxyacyl-CoA dehydrogenase NAD-binding domain-containing protein [Chloroflexota bacterium]
MTKHRPLPTQVKSVGIIGGGTIGSSWAAYFLSRGLKVHIVDPNLSNETITDVIDQMWVGLAELGLPEQADKSQLSVTDAITSNLANVDFVQENSPERLATKQTVLAELEQVISPEIVISSSTSALLPSEIQANCQHPERVLAGHPFNPPHLVPLVEVVAGKKTTSDAVDWTMDFYQFVGRYPVHVKKEVVGHIANRLTAALYREVVHLIADGIGTVEDVDAVITQGPGLRWALMGPNTVYHLAGGQGGIQHYMDHLGYTQEMRWQELGNPRLTDEVRQTIVDGVTDMVGDQTIADLEAQRNERLIRLLQAIK